MSNDNDDRAAVRRAYDAAPGFMRLAPAPPDPMPDGIDPERAYAADAEVLVSAEALRQAGMFGLTEIGVLGATAEAMARAALDQVLADNPDLADALGSEDAAMAEAAMTEARVLVGGCGCHWASYLVEVLPTLYPAGAGSMDS